MLWKGIDFGRILRETFYFAQIQLSTKKLKMPYIDTFTMSHMSHLIKLSVKQLPWSPWVYI